MRHAASGRRPVFPRRGRRATLAAFGALFLTAVAAWATGGIEGRILDPEGSGVSGVLVRSSSFAAAEIAGADGRFRLRRVSAGEHEVLFSLGDYQESRRVTVAAGAATQVEITLDWPLAFAEKLTVQAASRQTERIVEAPAAVSTLTRLEIERRSSSGQLPKLVASTPGAQLTQSGLYDFNLNVRGFNSLINRRILVRIDGRDPSAPIQLGTQEWAAAAMPLDELERVELVRGPVTALYGAGAFNGVLNLVTKSPLNSAGGMVRLVGGELSTRRIEGRFARVSGSGRWAYKLYGGLQEGASFSRSRNRAVEYRPDLLNRELIALPQDRVQVETGGVRLDGELGDSALLSLEAGMGSFRGTTALTANGRFQSLDTRRPWGRANLSLPGWNFLGYYTARDTDDIRGLASNSMGYLDTSTTGLEAQTHRGFGGGRGRLVAGASLTLQDLDTADPRGVQTILPRPIATDHQAAFGQASWDLSDRLRGVFSLRWDEGTLHDAELSPRAALVYARNPRHTLRLSYGEAFQRPAVPDLFLDIPVGPSFDLSALEELLAPLLGGVPLGFADVPFVAVGNQNLRVEKVRSFEVGYNAVLGESAFLTVSLYRNELEDFVTGLLLQVGTSLGRLNPSFAAYRPPAQLPADAAAAVLAALDAALPPEIRPFLSNDAAGLPVVVLLSQANFGRVDTQGLELSFSCAIGSDWRAAFNYAYFDFDIRSDAPENPLASNAPAHQLGIVLEYAGERSDGALEYRWVDEVDWVSGLFAGPVPAYGVVDVAASRQLNRHWRLGLDVANLLDEAHYEVFGGDLLRRRALASLTYAWGARTGGH